MKRMAAWTGLAALAVMAVARAETVDGIVATVGTEVILQSEIMGEIAPMVKDIQAQSKNEQEFNEKIAAQLRKALDQAVEFKILLREALLAGVEITDEQLEKRIEDRKKDFGSAEAFDRELERAGETMSDFRNRMKKQLLALSMGWRKHKEFEKAAQIAEADVLQYYEDNKDKFTHQERVRVRRIFVAATSDAKDRAKAKAKIQQLNKQIEGGADFGEIAKSFSAGPDAEKGGLLGWVSRGDLVANLEEAAFALPEGAVSGILETEGGFVILKVEKKEASGAIPIEEARTLIEPQLRAKYADDAYNKWMGELRKRSRVRLFI